LEHETTAAGFVSFCFLQQLFFSIIISSITPQEEWEDKEKN
jgi:hypothetical protein